MFQKNLQAQRYATEQRKNFGEEIAQAIRVAKKRRWETAEEKRIKQEIDLENYLLSLIKLDKERRLENIKQGEPEDECRAQKVSFFLDFLNFF